MAHGGRNGLCRRLTSSDLQRCRHHARVESAACLHKQQQPTPLLKRREGGSAEERSHRRVRYCQFEPMRLSDSSGREAV